VQVSLDACREEPTTSGEIRTVGQEGDSEGFEIVYSNKTWIWDYRQELF